MVLPETAARMTKCTIVFPISGTKKFVKTCSSMTMPLSTKWVQPEKTFDTECAEIFANITDGNSNYLWESHNY